MSDKKVTNKKNKNSKELTVKHNFIQYGGEFKKVRKQYLEEEKKAMQMVDKNIKREKKDLEIAFSAYNKKLNTIIESKEYQDIQQKAGNLSQEMSKTLYKARKEFTKISQQISERNDWNNEKKQKKIQELYNYVISKFYSKEEVNQFNKLMNSMIVSISK